MSSRQQSQQTLVLGILVAALGLICLGGGVALLAWRVLAPGDAVILPPGLDTPEITPTPGILDHNHALLPPPLPGDAVPLVILPVSERPTPTGVLPTPSITPLPTQLPPTSTPSPPPLTTAPTLTAPSTESATVTPTIIPTPTATPAAPDRIIINVIGLDAPVVPVGQHPLMLDGQLYSQWDVPDERAAGWQQSSAPLGQIGNTVLNGHHNVYGEVFHHLVLLKPGDIVTLEAGDQRHYYIVAQTITLAEEGQPVEVRQANARWVLPTDDERVTLITCWPYNANTHRLVVIALPLSELGDSAEIP